MRKLPSEIVSMLARDGTKDEDIVYWMLCDRLPEGGFANNYLVLTRKYLFICTCTDTVEEKTFKGYPSMRHKRILADRPLQWSSERVPVEEIESILMVNPGVVVLKEANERFAGMFTSGEMKRAVQFAQAFDHVKKNENSCMGDLDEENGTASCPKCGVVFPEEHQQTCPKCMKRQVVFTRLLSFAGKYKPSIFFIVLFMLLNSLTGLVIPYFQGTVLFDQALANSGAFAGKIGLVVLIIVVFRTLSLLFGILYGVVLAKLAAKVAFDLKATVFSSMQRLSLDFFMRRQTGHLMTRVNNDAQELQYFFVDGISYFIVNAMNIIGILAVLLWMDWQLTLLCLLPMPLVFWFVRNAFPKLWRLSWRRHRKISSLQSIISDSISGSRVVKAFGKERMEIDRFQQANVAYSGVEQNFNKMSGTIFPALNLLTQLGGIMIWAYGGWSVIQGHMSLGAVLTFIHYMVMLYGPIQFMNNIVGWWSNCMSAAQRIFEIQDATPDVVERPGAQELPEMKGEIVVDRVSFGYEPNNLILKNVSFTAKPGQLIGIVGHSGAGKSTLVNLISRLYDVNAGEIRIDGYNLKDLSTASLRNQIGIVSQDVYVFTGSVTENIAYANPECSMVDIIHAAKIAKAHDYIEQLSDGYDTPIGSGGHSLSGGEKQRISIARAILHNPKVLILDEATASLDTETELQIQEALDSLVRGRTTIAIAHRLSTLRNADYLIVMDRGTIVDTGTHEELIQRDGIYRELVRKHDEGLRMKEDILV